MVLSCALHPEPRCGSGMDGFRFAASVLAGERLQEPARRVARRRRQPGAQRVLVSILQTIMNTSQTTAVGIQFSREPPPPPKTTMCFNMFVCSFWRTPVWDSMQTNAEGRNFVWKRVGCVWKARKRRSLRQQEHRPRCAKRTSNYGNPRTRIFNQQQIKTGQRGSLKEDI